MWPLLQPGLYTRAGLKVRRTQSLTKQRMIPVIHLDCNTSLDLTFDMSTEGLGCCGFA